MKIQIINIPHLAIGSRLAKEHLPPLGLLSIAGPLIDAGHDVRLLDAEWGPMPYDEITATALSWSPDFILMGHSGSSSAQPIINEIARLIRHSSPTTPIIIGGVFPTFHWEDILNKKPQIDYIILGEGEQTTLNLITALEKKHSPSSVKGIAFRKESTPYRTPSPELIHNLDNYRIAWELMEKYNYTYWGKKKAVVLQFSRGCPYPCTYCGQSLFWKKWRHRDPHKLADEIEMLHRKYGVKVINFADENPSSEQQPWLDFLHALIDKKLDIILVGSIRADNIVRDANYLHLYKKAGFERFLLGIENYDNDILKKIKKAGSVTQDMQAIRLLRQHNIIAMATYVVGFGEEKIKDLFHSLRQLLTYDPDQIQLLYATPHKWTPYYEEIKNREIILNDLKKWDYKHQVLKTKLKPWVLILCVKIIEAIMQSRPKALMRLFFHKQANIRHAMWWYTSIGKRVWVYELWQFFFIERRLKHSETVRDFWNKP